MSSKIGGEGICMYELQNEDFEGYNICVANGGKSAGVGRQYQFDPLPPVFAPEYGGAPAVDGGGIAPPPYADAPTMDGGSLMALQSSSAPVLASQAERHCQPLLDAGDVINYMTCLQTASALDIAPPGYEPPYGEPPLGGGGSGDDPYRFSVTTTDTAPRFPWLLFLLLLLLFAYGSRD